MSKYLVFCHFCPLRPRRLSGLVFIFAGMWRRWPRGWRRGPGPRRAASPRRAPRVRRWWWRAARIAAPGAAPSVSSSLTPRQRVLGIRSLGADLAVVAGGGQQQEEPLRATPNTPPPSTTPPRGASPARAPSTEPMHTEEEEANSGAGGFASAPDVGGEGVSASQPGTGKSLAFRLCSFSLFF
jgi:hypothetical protein